MFEDYSILTLLSIIIGATELITIAGCAVLHVIRKKVQPNLDDYYKLGKLLKYAQLDPIEMDDENIDQNIMDDLDEQSGVGKYDELSVTKKKRKKWVKENQHIFDASTRKAHCAKLVSAIEAIMLVIVKMGVLGVIIAGFFTVAKAEPVEIYRKHNVGYTFERCLDAALTKKCNFTIVGQRWLYKLEGVTSNHHQNCKIGGNTAKKIAQDCLSDPFCHADRGNYKCDQWCFKGYDTVSFNKLNVTKHQVTLYTGFNCGSRYVMSHTLTCPYGFILYENKTYCLNNNGHVSERWLLLDEEDDERAATEFAFPDVERCSKATYTTYKQTVEHINPNDCIVYDYRASPGADTTGCGDLPVVPINESHVVVYCNNPCLDYSNKIEYPCNQVVPMSEAKFNGCKFSLSGLSRYDKEICGAYEVGDRTTKEDIRETVDELTDFDKLPRYLWLGGLSVIWLIALIIEIKCY